MLPLMSQNTGAALPSCNSSSRRPVARSKPMPSTFVVAVTVKGAPPLVVSPADAVASPLPLNCQTDKAPLPERRNTSCWPLPKKSAPAPTTDVAPSSWKAVLALNRNACAPVASPLLLNCQKDKAPLPARKNTSCWPLPKKSAPAPTTDVAVSSWKAVPGLNWKDSALVASPRPSNCQTDKAPLPARKSTSCWPLPKKSAPAPSTEVAASSWKAVPGLNWKDSALVASPLPLNCQTDKAPLPARKSTSCWPLAKKSPPAPTTEVAASSWKAVLALKRNAWEAVASPLPSNCQEDKAPLPARRNTSCWPLPKKSSPAPTTDVAVSSWKAVLALNISHSRPMSWPPATATAPS